MRRIRIDIAKSLNFTARLNNNERKFNVTLQASPGVVGNSRLDNALYSGLGSFAKRIAKFSTQYYVMTADGALFRDSTLIAAQYEQASFFSAEPSSTAPIPFLYVAGGSKMHKVAAPPGESIYNWGIVAPIAAPNVAAVGGSTPIIARYAYQYYSSISDQRSNRSPATGIFNSSGQDVQVGLLNGSSDPQVTHIFILRDTNGDGVFREVGTILNDPLVSGLFLDTLDIVTGTVDTNDNGPPPVASLATLWRGSVWLNDVTNPRRLWPSVPGKLESFEIAGVNDIGEASDTIRAIGVIAGNLYVWTQNKVWIVSGEYPTFTFDAIADLGLISSYSISFSTDKATFATYTGVYTFNGATFTPLPDIWTFFDPDSQDPRRFTGIDINQTVVAANDRFTWVGWTTEIGERIMFQYSNFTQTWTERSPLSAILHDREPFHQIAGDYNNQIITLNSFPERGPFVLTTPQLELDGAKFISVEADGIGDFFLGVHIDGKPSVFEAVTLHNVDGIRGRHTVPLPDNSFGRLIYVTCEKVNLGTAQIADIWVNYDELPIPVQLFDTGEVPLSNNETLPQNLILHVFAKELITVSGQLFIDGQLAYSGEIGPMGPGYVGPLRIVVPPIEARSARVILRSIAYFCVMNIELGLTPLGDDVVKYVDLGGTYPTISARRQVGDVAKASS